MGSDGVERIRLKVISKCNVKNGFRWCGTNSFESNMKMLLKKGFRWCGTNSFESNIKMHNKNWVQMVRNEFV